MGAAGVAQGERGIREAGAVEIEPVRTPGLQGQPEPIPIAVEVDDTGCAATDGDRAGGAGVASKIWRFANAYACQTGDDVWTL